MATYEYKIGTTYAGLTNLESLTTPVFAPKHEPTNYSKPTVLGDAQVASLGWLTTAWHWDFMTQAQYTQLKQFCSGLSASVYINTKKNSGSYQTYSAIMLWPTPEPEVTNGKMLDVTVSFRAMVEVSS